jgi:hypothetical protein
MRIFSKTDRPTLWISFFTPIHIFYQQDKLNIVAALHYSLPAKFDEGEMGPLPLPYNPNTGSPFG